LAVVSSVPEFEPMRTIRQNSAASLPDKNKARQMGAREYFVKPHSLDELIKIMLQLHVRWLAAASPDATINACNNFRESLPFFRSGLIAHPLASVCGREAESGAQAESTA